MDEPEVNRKLVFLVSHPLPEPHPDLVVNAREGSGISGGAAIKRAILQSVRPVVEPVRVQQVRELPFGAVLVWTDRAEDLNRIVDSDAFRKAGFTGERGP